MGTWSLEPFGNDTACDWAYDLEESTDLSLIQQAFAKVLAADKEEGYVDADDGQEALAALEVVFKLKDKGTQSDSYTEGVDHWVQQHPQPIPQTLIDLAQQALAVLSSEKSELTELWEEEPLWQENLKVLTKNLTALREIG